MAALMKNLSRNIFLYNSYGVKTLLKEQNPIVCNVRNNGFFNYLQNEKEHNKKEYDYEVTNDPEEWKHVEHLLPFETVPKLIPKPSYPSGWRPMKEESLKLPYFAERSKNHMLSVYLDIYDRGQLKITKLKRIHGDLWLLHDELKAYVEENLGKRIASSVNEGNCTISFKGDFVYYVEQWLLSKGF